MRHLCCHVLIPYFHALLLNHLVNYLSSPLGFKVFQVDDVLKHNFVLAGMFEWLHITRTWRMCSNQADSCFIGKRAVIVLRVNVYLVCSSRLAISQPRLHEINNPRKIFNPIKSVLSRLLYVFLSLPTGIWQIHLAELKVINVLGRREGVRMSSGMLTA